MLTELPKDLCNRLRLYTFCSVAVACTTQILEAPPPQWLLSQEAIAPFGDKADGLSRPHVELVNKSGVIVQAKESVPLHLIDSW